LSEELALSGRLTSFQVFLVFLAAWAALLFVPFGVRAQDAVQALGADQALSGNQGQVSNPDYYNLKTGPVSFRFQSGLGIVASDNINYTDTNRVSDLYFDPQFKVQAFWPVTLDNSLYFNTGIGYVAYLQHSALDHFDINPDSNLSFQMYVSDVSINFHERLSLSDDLAQAPTVSGTGTYLQLENVCGVDAVCPLDDVILTVGYDHDWVTYPGSQFQASGGNSDFLYGQAEITNSFIHYGAEAGAGMTYYDQNILSDNLQASAGGFVQGQVTDHFSARASAGVASYFFSSSGSGANISDVVGYYASLSLDHRINQWLSQSLSGGRRYEQAADVDLLELYYAYYEVGFNAINQLPITLRLIYEHGRDYGGPGETFDRYGVSLKAQYELTQKLTGVAEYDFTDRNSDITAASYAENRVTLQLVYNF